MTAPRVSTVASILALMIYVPVDHPEAVRIESVDSKGQTTFTVFSDPRDIGKIIGCKGRTANALRSLLGSIGATEKRRYFLIVNEGDEPKPSG
jgi:uncharacterized protein